jgi:hypothetical protein
MVDEIYAMSRIVREVLILACLFNRPAPGSSVR